MVAFQTSLSSRNLYTIGWVCALPLERAAATAVLDARHSRPLDFAQPRNDVNSYTWGNIGEHNVVIASLPAGEYGTASAAGVAMAMLVSFPEVRFGLMVGIGAGVPRKDRDIRLGDVVVSRPHGRSGGVVQYDFVKAIQNLNVVSGGTLERIGSLNSPPRVLLNAVSTIQAQHDLEPTRIPEFINQMLTRFPNQFPCLVIRGICDYADAQRLLQRMQENYSSLFRCKMSPRHRRHLPDVMNESESFFPLMFSQYCAVF